MIADLLINVVNGIAQNEFLDFLRSYKSSFSTFIIAVKNVLHALPPPKYHMLADSFINVVNGIAQNDFRDFLPSYKSFSTFIRPVKNFPHALPPPPYHMIADSLINVVDGVAQNESLTSFLPTKVVSPHIFQQTFNITVKNVPHALQPTPPPQ